jgi:hypothetical protein
VEDNGVYDREYIAHCVEKTKNKRKQRRNNGGQLRSLTVSDDIGDLLCALDTKSDGAAGGSGPTVYNSIMEKIDNPMLRNSKP